MALGKRVAKNVKAIRLQRGLSQQDLANKTGLTVRYISRLENSAPNLTLEVLEKLAKGLGCSVNELLGNQEEYLTTESQQLLDQTINFLQSIRSRL